ncbi:hypothetical protein PsorP6_005583 [Peronosclerospora sorghi]|uniref:Uncharacterized protein n=1 Tax=Peronosclerospora sorghi TaxID=230839 RepID=A0ACC0W6Z3_9STRA|nr:hypothetical protein PsorP6_005583 [Peronosclerospora sorghi]
MRFWRRSTGNANIDLAGLRQITLRFHPHPRAQNTLLDHMAAKLGGRMIRIFGADYIIKTSSIYDRMYFVDLKNVPSDLEDDAIFDYFARLGLAPLVTPTYQVGALASRDRTVWFDSLECPGQLLSPEGAALREIFFEGFRSPVFVQHKRRALNVTPPSIVKRQEEERREMEEQRQPAPPANQEPDETSPLRKPQTEFQDSFLEWSIATSRISLSNPQQVTPEIMYRIYQTQKSDGRMVFGIPCHPTRFEIFFKEPGDDDDEDDTDVDVYVENQQVASVPLVPIPEFGKTISAYAFLDAPRAKMRRSQLREMSKNSCKLFKWLTEPEGRLEDTTAQPHILKQTVDEPSDIMDTAIT